MKLYELGSFLKRYRYQLLFAYLITLAAFGFMLTNQTLSIDEETRLANTGTNWTWATQGRFGISLFNLILSPSGDYVPFLWDFLAVALWFSSGALSCYLLFIKSGAVKRAGTTIFIYCAYYATVPLVTGEILSFSMFNLHVALAMNMSMLAFAMLLDWAYNKRMAGMILSALLLAAAISVYQAAICVFAALTAAKALLHVHIKETGTGKLWAKAFAVCAASILIYALINGLLSLMIHQGSYLFDSYLGWRDPRGVLYAFAAAVANVIRYSFGLTIFALPVYGGVEIGIATGCLLVFCLLALLRAHGIRAKALYLLLTGILVASPFALYLLLGTHNTTGRMLLGMPIVQGFGIVMLMNELKGRHTQYAALILTGLLLFANVRNMNTLFYDDSVRYQRDVATAGKILADLEDAGADYHLKPVIFVGKYAGDDVGLVSSGAIGQSFFAWDDGNNSRITDFMRTLGYAFILPSREQCLEAAQFASGMPPWPTDGSIRIADEYVIVHLSHPSDLWYRVNAN